MTDTTPNVPRELLEVIEQTWRIHYRGGPVTTDIAADAIEKGLGQLRALLSAPSPAGVDADHVEGVRAMVVPRELFENLIEQHITAHGCTTGTAREAQLLLSAPSSAGVDGLEVVEYQERSIYGNWNRIYKLAYDKRLAAGCPEQFRTLSVTADAQAIIDGLRDQLHVAHEKVGRYADQRDQLAGHLEFAVTMLTVAGLAENAQVSAMSAALAELKP